MQVIGPDAGLVGAHGRGALQPVNQPDTFANHCMALGDQPRALDSRTEPRETTSVSWLPRRDIVPWDAVFFL